ncbi:MAG: anion transporter [Crocinitomicaceae bacterium]|nr:anion transporter [Crocinitomicaceae bacterium]|tara:strand:+ start:41194 stop:42576 length:1383 start_codon:yes stop_codon:yes gene_type:complete
MLNKKIITFLGLFLFLFVLLFFTFFKTNEIKFYYSLALSGLMILFWLFEVVPIYVTALFPLALGVPLGLIDVSDLTSCYGHKYIYLFLGGFMFSLALEKWSAHRQISESIIRVLGSTKSRILLGFLVSSALLSMWISNTATTLMMLPMAIAVIEQIKKESNSKFSVFLLLVVAYGASIGGMSTLVGSPPNILMAGLLEENYGVSISFFDWMKLGLPLSLIMLIVVYVIFYFYLGSERNDEVYDNSCLAKKKWSKNQIRVVFLFSLIIILWSFRVSISSFTGIKYTDEGVAIFGAILLFFIPSSHNNDKLLKWNDTKKLPWGILILFGGGMSLAKILELNGVIDKLTFLFTNYSHLPLIIILFLLVAIAIFGTEIMSNMALVSVFVPFVATFSLSTDYSLIQLCMPITLAASCAFMLPVGTPPNAIVFSSGHLKVHNMMKTGFLLNLISVIIIVLYSIIFI